MQFLSIEVKMTLYQFSIIANASLQKRSLKEKIVYGKRSPVYFDALFISFLL